MARVRPKKDTIIPIDQVEREIKDIPEFTLDNIPIVTMSSDSKGHSIQLRFSVPKYYGVVTERIRAEYPQCESSTDVYRAIFYVGTSVLMGKVADVALDESTREMYLDLKILERELEMNQLKKTARESPKMIQAALREGIITKERAAEMMRHMRKLAEELGLGTDGMELLGNK